MHIDQYTPDAICRSMGLEGYIERGWSAPGVSAVRLLLTPSFSPEVCITLDRRQAAVTLRVVALSEMYWPQQAPCRLMEYREELPIDPEVFDRATRDFSRALAESLDRPSTVWVDGMGLECCCSSAGEVRRFARHSLSCRASFVSGLIVLAWRSSALTQIRNALARCGTHLGMSLAIEPEPLRRRIVRMMVLGVPEEKADFFDRLSWAASGPRLRSARAAPAPTPPV